MDCRSVAGDGVQESVEQPVGGYCEPPPRYMRHHAVTRENPTSVACDLGTEPSHDMRTMIVTQFQS